MVKKKNIFGVSILSTDFFDIKNTVKKINSSDVDFVHFDVMDGVFVDNISFGPHFIKSITKEINKKSDVHLMIENPLPYIKNFVEAGADVVTVHLESQNTMKSLKLIKKLGKKAGVVINPQTDILKVKKYLDIIDVVMIMCVEPGFGGQKFILSQLEKIKNISDMIKKYKRKILIQVDGGINFETGKLAVENGANYLVSGSFVFNQPSFSKAVKFFKNL